MLEAVKTASTVLGSFREMAPDASDLAVIAARIEATLARELTDEQFVTAIVGQVSADGSKVELLNRGHPPPLLVDGAGPRLLETAAGGLPLGLAQLADAPDQPAVIEIGPGDRMLFYTDGVSEAAAGPVSSSRSPTAAPSAGRANPTRSWTRSAPTC